MVAPGRKLEIQLLHELNAGTFARLYVAEARGTGGLHRLVAVKIVREQWSGSTEILERTRDEARLLARLHHKNIVRVEELAEVDGQPAIIMEFVDGLDLKQIVEEMARKKEQLPAKVALQVALETAAALEAAYFRAPYGMDQPLRVVHRDVKPSNVMIGVEGQLKVLDFGTARATQAFRSAQTGALRFGSLKYMSPERREGDRGEHAADVYAVGLMLGELLEGAWQPLLPMEVAEHDAAVLQWVGTLPDLGMPNREWDLALRKVLVQMMAGDPGTRPDASQVVKLMRAFVDQASGPTLEAFAEERVLPLTRQLRKDVTGGALAGTRLVVSVQAVDGADPSPVPVAAKPVAPPPTVGPPTLSRIPTNPAPPRTADVMVARIQEPARPTGPVQSVMPIQAGPATKGPPGRADAGGGRTNLGDTVRNGITPPRTNGVTASPTPAATPVQNGMAGARLDLLGPTIMESVLPPPKPVVKPKPAGNMAMIGAAVAAAGLLGGAMVVAVVVLYLLLRGLDTSDGFEPVPPAATKSTTAPPPVAPPAAAVSLTVSGVDVQWFKVSDEKGAVLLKAGKDGGKVEPGTWDMALKVVGRPEVKGRVVVPAAGAALSCTMEKDGAVRCGGTASEVTLR